LPKIVAIAPMSPEPRLEFEGALYHVISRGNRREPIFEDDEDRDTWLAVLAEALDKGGQINRAVEETI
jgi:hypothetical protein